MSLSKMRGIFMDPENLDFALGLKVCCMNSSPPSLMKIFPSVETALMFISREIKVLPLLPELPILIAHLVLGIRAPLFSKFLTLSKSLNSLNPYCLGHKMG